MKTIDKLLLLIIVMLWLSVMSYGQDSQNTASSLKTKQPEAVSFEDAFTTVLNRLDNADEYIKKLEIEKAVADERLQLEKERTALLNERLAAKDSQLAANEREKQAMLKIDVEKDNQLKLKDERIAKLEKKKGGGFLKGFGIGFITGFVASKFKPF